MIEESVTAWRDVWLIEITGGPSIECPTCADYQYIDLTHNFWPALINGVLGQTGYNKFDYVGFSNGCRVALDALATGEINPNKVDTFVGVGCPGAFEGVSTVKTAFIARGNSAVKKLRDAGLKHTSFTQALQGLFPFYQIYPDGTSKISVNLFDQYVEWASSSQDQQPAEGLSIDNFNVIYGKISPFSDGAVTVTDNEAIFDNVNADEGKLMRIGGAPHGGIGSAISSLILPEHVVTRYLIEWRVNNDSSMEFGTQPYIAGTK